MILRIFLNYYVALAVICSIFYFWTLKISQPLSLFLGAFLSGTLFLLSYAGWKGIFEKKFVALSAMVIVIKYAILVFFVYFFSQLSWVSIGWLVGGIITFKVPLFFVALDYSKQFSKGELAKQNFIED